MQFGTFSHHVARDQTHRDTAYRTNNKVAQFSLSRLLFISLLCLSLTACTRNDTLPTSVTQSFELAFTRDDLPGCLALFAEDAQILPEHGSVISGHKEIEQFLKNQMTPVISFNTQPDMTLVRGDVAIEQGHFKVRDIRHGSDIEMGKYVHIWRKIKGNWLIYRIIYNTDVAPKGEVTVEPAEADRS